MFVTWCPRSSEFTSLPLAWHYVNHWNKGNCFFGGTHLIKTQFEMRGQRRDNVLFPPKEEPNLLQIPFSPWMKLTAKGLWTFSLLWKEGPDLTCTRWFLFVSCKRLKLCQYQILAEFRLTFLVMVGAKGGHGFWASWVYPQMGEVSMCLYCIIYNEKKDMLSHIPKYWWEVYPSMLLGLPVYHISIHGVRQTWFYLPEVPMFSIETVINKHKNAHSLKYYIRKLMTA